MIGEKGWYIPISIPSITYGMEGHEKVGET